MSALNDLEYRVWTDYELVADDFGVLPYSPSMVRAGNPALAARPEPVIQSALNTLVTVGLVLRFEHQGQSFICDPTWQKFQKIERPRRTHYPLPDPATMERCTAETILLFARYHPAASAFPFPKLFANARRIVAKCLRKSRTEDRTTRGLSSRLTANGKRLTARGSETGGGAGEPEPTFEAFYRPYPRKAGRDAAARAWASAITRAAPAEILAGLMRQLPELTSREPKFIPHPATWLNQGRWQDEVAPRSLVRPATAQAVREFVARGECP